MALLATGEGISLVFTDAGLADGSSGADLAVLVKHAFPSVRILVTTGRVEPPSLPDSIPFIPKPYTRACLTRALDIQIALSIFGIMNNEPYQQHPEAIQKSSVGRRNCAPRPPPPQHIIHRITSSQSSSVLPRRHLLLCAGLAPLSALQSCSTTDIGSLMPEFLNRTPGKIPSPAPPKYMRQPPTKVLTCRNPYRQIEKRFYRQRISDPTGERAGTVVVDTKRWFLYLVEQGGTAVRYGVSIGKDGFGWQGEGVIQWRKNGRARIHPTKWLHGNRS